jgi:glucose-1-phosphate adenylyltransferase
VLPQAIGWGEARAYPFLDPHAGQPGYWRDVGTVDAYFQASRELLAPHPPILPQDRAWRVHGYVTSTAPSIVDCREGGGGFVDRSLLGPGSLVRDAYVANSIVSADVEVQEDAEISEAILFEGVSVGAGVRLRRTIVDKGVAIPRGTKVGFDAAWDRARGLHVTDAGVTVVPKGYVFGRERCDGAAELSRTMHVRSNAVGANPRT